MRKEPWVIFIRPLHMPSTMEVRRNPAATINMVAIKIVLVLENPANAPLASMHPVMYRAAMENMAVSHIGILFNM